MKRQKKNLVLTSGETSLCSTGTYLGFMTFDYYLVTFFFVHFLYFQFGKNSIIPQWQHLFYFCLKYSFVHRESKNSELDPPSSIWCSLTYISTMPSNFAFWLKLDCKSTVNFQPFCPFFTKTAWSHYVPFSHKTSSST